MYQIIHNMTLEETKDKNIILVQALPEGKWAVRWNFEPKLDEEGNETEVNQYIEHLFNWIPSIEDIQQVIIAWYNKQTDNRIKHGFKYKGIEVYLNEENKFNYKAITDEVARRERLIKDWDIANPEIAGLSRVEEETSIFTDNGEERIIHVSVPTGRPKSLLPITLKLGKTNEPQNFYVFGNLEELQDFFAQGVDHLLKAYAVGWERIAQIDWSVYEEALKDLNK